MSICYITNNATSIVLSKVTSHQNLHQFLENILMIMS